MNSFVVCRYFRLSPFDISTEKGRADERYRLAFLSLIANILSKGIAMVVMVLSVKLTLPYLGSERFGAWMTIASFASMLTFLDLGVGNALTNRVAKAAANGEINELRQAVSGGLGFLFLLGWGVALILIIVANFAPWDQVIKTENRAATGEIRDGIILFSCFFGINLFTNGIQRVFAGLQRAFEGHLVSALGFIFSLITLYWAVYWKAGIPVLLAATLGVQSISGLFLLIILIRRNFFKFSGMTSSIHAEKNKLLHTGGAFFILQIGTMVGWGSDSLIISSTLGALHVAIFSVTQRLFQFITLPLSMANSPLWGSYADAHSRNEYKFIRLTLKKSILFTILISVSGSIFIASISSWVINKWTTGNIIVPLSLIVAYACWAVLDSIGNAFAMFLNGCGIFRPQVCAALVLCLITIPLKIWLIKSAGLTYMIMGFCFLYILVFSFFYGIAFRENLGRILCVDNY